jgi:predicted aspartyl protease
MSHPYNADYTPSIPILEITLIAVSGEQMAGPLPAIVDTGADGTIVPTSHLEWIGALEAVPAWLSSHLGERKLVWLYLVDLRVEAFTLPGVYVVGDDQANEIILGRNVLNKLRILLDGPAQLTEVLEGQRRRRW